MKFKSANSVSCSSSPVNELGGGLEMSDRGYLSIGEVLDLLKAEFPDITISKIRFLESQGLLEPERTASGYRKFYEPDVERLRFILQQQKEKYLPLKVIRGQLGGESVESLAGSPGATDATWSVEGAPGSNDDRGSVEPLDAATMSDAQGRHPTAFPRPPVRVLPAALSSRPGAPPQRVSSRRATGSDVAGSDVAGSDVASSVGASTDLVTSPIASNLGEGIARSAPLLAAGGSGVSMNLDELASASGFTVELVRQLEQFGLIVGRGVFSQMYYDEEALLVAHVAAGFLQFGVEPRHLRIYKTSAEREAGLFEQVVTPQLKRRNPEARSTALANLAELARLGEQLRAVTVRQVLRSATDAK